MQKKAPRISKNLRNFGHDRLKIFYIYNSYGISLKNEEFLARQRTFWDIRTQKIYICTNSRQPYGFVRRSAKEQVFVENEKFLLFTAFT